MIYEMRKPRQRKYEPKPIPAELDAIDCEWTNLSNAEGRKRGDIGTCVLGAGFDFYYQNRFFHMAPTCRYQGSIMWEHSKDRITELLKQAGATEIYYHWGTMD